MITGRTNAHRQCPMGRAGRAHSHLVCAHPSERSTQMDIPSSKLHPRTRSRILRSTAAGHASEQMHKRSKTFVEDVARDIHPILRLHQDDLSEPSRETQAWMLRPCMPRIRTVHDSPTVEHRPARDSGDDDDTTGGVVRTESPAQAIPTCLQNRSAVRSGSAQCMCRTYKCQRVHICKRVVAWRHGQFDGSNPQPASWTSPADYRKHDEGELPRCTTYHFLDTKHDSILAFEGNDGPAQQYK